MFSSTRPLKFRWSPSLYSLHHLHPQKICESTPESRLTNSDTFLNLWSQADVEDDWTDSRYDHRPWVLLARSKALSYKQLFIYPGLTIVNVFTQPLVLSSHRSLSHPPRLCIATRDLLPASLVPRGQPQVKPRKTKPETKTSRVREGEAERKKRRNERRKMKKWQNFMYCTTVK